MRGARGSACMQATQNCIPINPGPPNIPTIRRRSVVDAAKDELDSSISVWDVPLQEVASGPLLSLGVLLSTALVCAP